MKCEIIRDLFPSYIDGLTSKESNEAISEHLENCEECPEILKQMKEEVKVDNVEANKKDIKPFKKLNKKVRKGVIITASIFMVIIAGVYATFVGWKVSSDEVEVTYSYNENVIELHIELKGNMNMLITSDSLPNRTIRKVMPLFGLYKSNGFTYAAEYKNEHGRFDESMLFQFTVEYADKKVVYDFAEIAEELGVREAMYD